MIFQIYKQYSKTQAWLLTAVGLVITIAVWWILAESFAIERPVYEGEEDTIENVEILDAPTEPATADEEALQVIGMRKVYPILPRPDQVLKAYPVLIQKDHLIPNTLRSIWLNLQGYYWAIFLSIPIGFLLGLIPVVRRMFSKQVDALRFLPLTALTGLFMTWFGLNDGMKVAFLAFGIIVYLLPVVVQRLDQVEQVYLSTAYTLGADTWDMVKRIFAPAVMSKLMDDIRVLTAISWTYIIIAELLNKQGGIGAMIYTKGRFGQIDKVFAMLLVIILIGVLQDRLFAYIDKRIYPHKYLVSRYVGSKELKLGIYVILVGLSIRIIGSFIVPGQLTMLNNILWITTLTGLVMVIYGEIRGISAKKQLSNA